MATARQLSIAETSHCLNPEQVVADWKVCDTIDNYNSSAYYEPSYVQTRAYHNGAF